MKIMHEEIFGPVLPVMTFKDKTEVPALINKRPKPLSMYIASKSPKNIQYYIDNTIIENPGNQDIMELSGSTGRTYIFNGVTFSIFKFINILLYVQTIE